MVERHPAKHPLRLGPAGLHFQAHVLGPPGFSTVNFVPGLSRLTWVSHVYREPDTTHSSNRRAQTLDLRLSNEPPQRLYACSLAANWTDRATVECAFHGSPVSHLGIRPVIPGFLRASLRDRPAVAIAPARAHRGIHLSPPPPPAVPPLPRSFS